MRPLFFAMKRIHLCGVRRLMPIAMEVELTPARFDMLQVLAFHDEWGIAQRTLVHLLGVSGAVVSRMLHALTKKGLVRRHRWERDRRVKIVHLTEQGMERYAEMFERHISDDDLASIELEVFGNLDPSPPEYRNRGLYAQLATWLGKLRRRLSDRAPFLHPWRLADFVDEDLRPVQVSEKDIDMAMPREDVLAERLFGPTSVITITPEDVAASAAAAAEIEAAVAEGRDLEPSSEDAVEAEIEEDERDDENEESVAPGDPDEDDDHDGIAPIEDDDPFSPPLPSEPSSHVDFERVRALAACFMASAAERSTDLDVAAVDVPPRASDAAVLAPTEIAARAPTEIAESEPDGTKGDDTS